MQLALQREAQSRNVFCPVGGILSNETLVARVAWVLLHESGIKFSNDDLQLVRD
jgi:hypothetical protein